MTATFKEPMTWGDLFAGGGGTTTGALCVPNVKVSWALNHSKEAIYTHEVNHPETEHFHADIKDMDEKKLSQVDGLWASLECTNFSNAKGGGPRDADSRTLAWELVRYIVWCDPSVITIENVKEFLSWGPLDKNGKPVSRLKGEDYLKWVEYIKSLGYENYEYKILNSANYGSHTRRLRYFGIFTKTDYPIVFPKNTHAEKNWNPCREKIDLSNEGKSIFGRKKPLVENTLKRIAHGIKKFHPDIFHVMQYYSSGTFNQSLNTPLRTITVKDRHALIQFVQQHYGREDASSSLEKPPPTITTANRHSLISVEKNQFISDHVWGAANQSINKPLNTICTKESKQLVFITKYYRGNNQNQSVDKPLDAILATNHHALVSMDDVESEHIEEKRQFITKYFSREPYNESIDKPLGAIMTNKKHALATVLINGHFDIKLRFLTTDELADITGFPKNYKWFGSNKFKMWMIGNAVPVELAAAVINELKLTFDEIGRCKGTPARITKSMPRESGSGQGLFEKSCPIL